MSTSKQADKMEQELQRIAHGNLEFVYGTLNSGSDGLTEQESRERLKEFGLNEIKAEKTPPWYHQLFNAFINPFVFILLLIAGVSFIVDIWMAPPGNRDFKTVIVVGVIVLISVLLRFIQEYRSNRAADALKKMVRTTATVLRKGDGKKEILMETLVPGDIVYLSAGDMVPADCRVIHNKDLFVSESMLTGESVPVEKTISLIGDATKKRAIELNNLCFMGTNIVSGAGIAIVLATGSMTYFASISHDIVRERPETTFDKGINEVSYLLIKFMLVMTPIIFLINGLFKGDWMDSFLFSIAVAVGLTPEMLPMVVTANLARGAMNMSKHQVIVKKLNAIQNIGAMDVLCADKTGTLTLDKIVLERYLNVHGYEDDEVLKWAYLNSFHQTGLKNLLDKAVLEHESEMEKLNIEKEFQKLDEIPFDFERRRMSVILNKEKTGKHLLVCKGAVEEMLDACSYAFDPGSDGLLQIDQDDIMPMTQEMRQLILDTSKNMNEDGLRVLLVAVKEFDGDHSLTYSIKDEKDLVLAGFIGFLDPAKPSAKPSIISLKELGVAIKVLTGDNEIVTKKICKDVGIDSDSVIIGEDMEKLSDDDLRKKIEEINIFAKLSPSQKVRIVRLLRENGHTVGFIGNGINDAAGLKEADVGISVDTSVDIAKESAELILLEKDLMVLKEAVVYGRRTFGNIIKYIKMAFSSNFGNVFSMIGASIMLPFLPMLPIHLLIQNLLYDLSQASIPWDSMDKEFLEQPKKWDVRGIKQFMLFIGPTSSVFDYVTYALMFYIFQANTPEHQSLFQTGWFIEGLLSQTLIIHMIRTRKIPFLQSCATLPVILLTTIIMIIGIWIPYSPFATALKMQALPISYFYWLIAILLAYTALTQIVKMWFIKKFSYWL